MSREYEDEFVLLRETEKAIQVSDTKTDFWLPKSQIDWCHSGVDGQNAIVTIAMPIWLAEEKGIV